MRVCRICLFAIGFILLFFNIIGLFKSLRNEDLYSEITLYKDDISIRYNEVKVNLERKREESDKDFAFRSIMLINHSMAH